MFTNLHHYLSPYFLNRHYIKKTIKETVKKYTFSNSLLDIGCGQKPYQNIFSNIQSYKGIDFEDCSVNKDFAKSLTDFYFDDTYPQTQKLPFEQNSFHNSVAFQVLEHHPKPRILAEEMVRITRPGGYIFLTVPFIGGLHEEPHDYQRYTEYGLRELFRDLPIEIIEIKGIGSLSSTIVCLLNEYMNILAAKKGFQRIVGTALYPLIMLLEYLSLIIDKFIVARHLVFNYSFLARKL